MGERKLGMGGHGQARHKHVRYRFTRETRLMEVGVVYSYWDGRAAGWSARYLGGYGIDSACARALGGFRLGRDVLDGAVENPEPCLGILALS